jgi:hypothetical protein
MSLGPIQFFFLNEFLKKMLPLQNPSRSVMNFILKIRKYVTKYFFLHFNFSPLMQDYFERKNKNKNKAGLSPFFTPNGVFTMPLSQVCDKANKGCVKL